MRRGGMFFKYFLWMIIALSAFTAFVMLLWNWLVPSIFGGPVISFFQAAGLLILSKILFGGWGGWRHKKHYWREKMRRKVAGMTPEEREHFKARFKEKWGCHRAETKTSTKDQPEAN